MLCRESPLACITADSRQTSGKTECHGREAQSKCLIEGHRAFRDPTPSQRPLAQGGSVTHRATLYNFLIITDVNQKETFLGPLGYFGQEPRRKKMTFKNA